MKRQTKTGIEIISHQIRSTIVNHSIVNTLSKIQHTNKNSTAFWKDVQKMTSSNIPLASKVGDAVGNEQITDMWHHHFSEILNSVHNTDSKSFVCDHIDSVSPKSKMLIDASAIIESLKEIKLGKSAGIDGLATEHFVYSHSSISVHLALLSTCMLNHGHVPTAFMKTSIIPILKKQKR